MSVPFFSRIQLFIIRVIIGFLNFCLLCLEWVLFRPLNSEPKNVLVFKIGNIGDLVCAIPVFVAIRRAYPRARITLLTCPRLPHIPGAKELLSGAWYFDEIKIYYSTDIDTQQKVCVFAKELRKNGYDLLIQVSPHEWTNFRYFFRNMIFAKLIGVRHAFGFKIRAINGLFKKTQVDYTLGRHDTDTLLEVLKENGIDVSQVEFDFPRSPESEARVAHIFREKWGNEDPTNGGKQLAVAIHSGSKRKEKQWAAERFGAVARYLAETHGARVIVMGGADDYLDGETILRELQPENGLLVAGKLSLPQSVAMIRRISFIVCTDSGLMHVAAAFGKPAVALFSVINVMGRWFPYGHNHETLYHTRLLCDYADPDCMKASMDLITEEEVMRACDRVIERLTTNDRR